ncbi:hypothetical protein [Flavobacterium sp.]|jgi:hypothetical protein|uniref:hypothetical protein n=1 Tax=Flavobacterium sp. TaxID=239 RepID=UPI0037C102CA
MFEYKVIENVLGQEMFNNTVLVGRHSKFKKVDVGLGDTLYLAEVPKNLEQHLINAVSGATGFNLSCIQSFFRLNTPDLNNAIRIHADSLINGIKPTVAGVFYLESMPGTGTALFEHKIFGRYSKDPSRNAIYKREEGWSAYMKYEAVANTMFVYNSDFYHARFPWEAYGHDKTDGRIVVVLFMRQV